MPHACRNAGVGNGATNLHKVWRHFQPAPLRKQPSPRAAVSARHRRGHRCRPLPPPAPSRPARSARPARGKSAARSQPAHAGCRRPPRRPLCRRPDPGWPTRAVQPVGLTARGPSGCGCVRTACWRRTRRLTCQGCAPEGTGARRAFKRAWVGSGAVPSLRLGATSNQLPHHR